ncbi:hypothetical protein [Caballeronia choica]|uniref:hypothetical protein n=1 Tax=Caballeronia choica TaxID=326476 RepID=UPI000F73B5FF|nr:hypothetical protein [Caballeronia choica]
MTIESPFLWRNVWLREPREPLIGKLNLSLGCLIFKIKKADVITRFEPVSSRPAAARPFASMLLLHGARTCTYCESSRQSPKPRLRARRSVQGLSVARNFAFPQIVYKFDPNEGKKKCSEH